MKRTLLTLLCGTDFSESGDVACEAALALGQRLNARVLLAHVIPPSAASLVLEDPEFGPFNRELARKAAEAENAVRAAIDRKLRVVATRFIGAGVPVETRLLDGRPADALCQAAVESGAAMIVVGTHGWTPPVRWFVGSVAERIVRESEVPVLVVRDREIGRIRGWADDAHRLQILVGCSPDKTCQQAVTLARVIAKGAEPATVTYGHVYWPPAEAAIRKLDGIDADGAVDVERELVNELRRQVGDPDAQVLVEPSFGRAADALAAHAADREADLLVLGNRGLRGTELLTEGSFALGAIRRAEVPVLCVPQNAELSAWVREIDGPRGGKEAHP